MLRASSWSSMYTLFCVMPVATRLNFLPSARTAEVLDDRGVPEQALHLVDVEPGGHAPLEVPVHPVAHALEDGDDPERAHVLGEVLEVDVGDPPLERDVRRVVEEGERPRHVPLVAQGYVAPLALGLGLEDAVEVPEQRDAGPRRPPPGMPPRRIC